MAIISEMAVAITAVTGKFDKGMKKSKKQLEGFRGQVDKAQKSLALFSKAKVAGVGVAAAFGGAVVMLKRTINTMGELSKRASQLQMTTRAFSELEHAAQMKGIDRDDLVGLLEEMSIRVSEAAVGAGTAAEAFDELGVNAAQLQKLAPDQVLEKMADALLQVDGMKRIELADKIFGGDGFKAISLLSQGSEGIRKMREEAQALGLSFDGDEVSDFLEKTKRFSQALEGMQRRFVIDISPAVSESIEGLRLIWESTDQFKLSQKGKEGREERREIRKEQIRRHNRNFVQRTANNIANSMQNPFGRGGFEAFNDLFMSMGVGMGDKPARGFNWQARSARFAPQLPGIDPEDRRRRLRGKKGAPDPGIFGEDTVWARKIRQQAIDATKPFKAPEAPRERMSFNRRQAMRLRFGQDIDPFKLNRLKPDELGSIQGMRDLAGATGAQSPFTKEMRGAMLADPNLPKFGPHAEDIPVEVLRKQNKDAAARHKEHMKKLEEQERARVRREKQRGQDMILITIPDAN